MSPDGMSFQESSWPWSVPSLARRIQDLKGLYVCLHVNTGRAVLAMDGICQGIEGDVVVLFSQGQRSKIRLREVNAVNRMTQED